MAVGYTHAGNNNTWKFFGEVLLNSALEEYYPKLVLHDMASHITLPGHRGKKVYVPQWNKVNPVSELNISASDGTDVDETVSPSAHEMTMKNYDGTIQGFGGSFKYSDIHASITEMMDELTAGARQLGGGYAVTVEDNALTTLLNALDDGAKPDSIAATIGANGKTWANATAADLLKLSDISRVRAYFESNVDGLTPAYPDGTYKGIIHPNNAHDLFTDVDSGTYGYNMVQWLQTSRGQGMFEANKIPVLHGVSLETSAYDTTDPYNSHAAWVDDNTDLTNQPFGAGVTGNPTGYVCMFFAPGAWSNLSLANATPSIIIQPFGSAGTEDSLKRKMTVGIKGYQTCIPQDMARRALFIAAGSTLVS